MKTNFQEWFIFYQSILSEHYEDFKKIFDNDKEVPCFHEFASYCFSNTRHFYNKDRRRYEAKIYRDY
jgi:hypothetical protein